MVSDGDITLNCSENDSEVLMAEFFGQSDPYYLFYRRSYITILLSLATCGIILNGTMLFILLRGSNTTGGRNRKPLSILVLQLLTANLFVSVFCLLTDGIWNIFIQWLGGDLLCRIIKFLQMFSLYVTTLLLVGISIESCVTLSYPLTRSHRSGISTRIRFIASAAWVLSAIMSAPQAVIFHVEKAPVCFEFYQCVTHGFYSNRTQEIAYTMATLCFMFIGPLIIIITCHFIIAVKIGSEAKSFLTNSKSMVNSEESSTSEYHPVYKPSQGIRVYNKSRRLSMMMTMMTAAVFVICWVPYYVMMIAHLFELSVSHETVSVIFCFGMSYAVVNPIIFAGFVFKRSNRKMHEMFCLRPNILS